MEENKSNKNMLYPSFPECLERYPPDLQEIIMSPSSIAGDHIGLESCTLATSCDDNNNTSVVAAAAVMVSKGECCYFSDRVRQRREERREMRRREYPPPIPLLARTENLPSHMPWVLRRYYTGDGRLILREEKVRHHEYLRAHRAEGRLTLHLVPMDQNVTTLFNNPNIEDHDCENDQEEGCEDEDIDHAVLSDGGGGGGGEEEDIDGGVVSSVGVGGGAGKCLAYSSNGHHHVGPSCNCIFGVPISPIRPVHS